MGCGGGNSSAGLLRSQQLSNEATNQAVGNIQNAFSGYTPNFYQGYAKAYQNSAVPQLQQQEHQASNQLGFKLSNQGLQKSSQAQQGYGALQDSYNQGLTQISNQGQQAAQGLQQQVANNEANLIGMAQSSTQPGTYIPQAQAAATSYGAPSTFAPIGQFFNNFANQYLGQSQAGLGNSLNTSLQSLFNNPYNFSTSGFIPTNH